MASSELQTAIHNLQTSLGSLSETFRRLDFLFSMIDVCLTAIHLIVLSRIRTSSTTMMVFGMALCDLLVTTITVERYFAEAEKDNPNCIMSDSSVSIYIDLFLWSVQDYLVRCSTWIGVILAVLRTVVLQFIFNPRFDKLSRPIYGTSLCFVVLFLLAIPSAFLFCRFKVNQNLTPIPECLSPNQTKSQFGLTLRELFIENDGVVMKTSQLVDALIARLLPSTLFLIFTILLLFELRRARESKGRAGDSQKGDLSTKTVVLFTLSSLITELPFGVLQYTNYTSTGIILLPPVVSNLSVLIRTLVSSLRPFFCFSLSSHYRLTFFRFFGIIDDPKPKASMISVSSMRLK